jgi:succinate dehydrogenase / fumarate reductase iron-sulfur subunit
VLAMIGQHDDEGCGWCTNTSECEAACPASISVTHIARMNREHLKATFAGQK